MTVPTITRSTGGFTKLPGEVSAEIWASTVENSIVQRLARRIDLPGRGVEVPVVTGDAVAGWVNEGEDKPVSASNFKTVTMTPYKVAVIEVFSNEFARDYDALYQALVNRLPLALGQKFDRTVLGIDTKPGDNFDQIGDAPTVDVTTDPHAGYLSALSSVAAAGGDVDAWVLSPTAEISAMGAVDPAKRPLLAPATGNTGIGQIIARPAHRARVAANTSKKIIGYGGEWATAVWGAVNEIQIKTSTDATITKDGQQINLFQRNMFAILVEAEFGFRVQDTQRFVQLKNGAVGD